MIGFLQERVRDVVGVDAIEGPHKVLGRIGRRPAFGGQVVTDGRVDVIRTTGHGHAKSGQDAVLHTRLGAADRVLEGCGGLIDGAHNGLRQVLLTQRVQVVAVDCRNVALKVLGGGALPIARALHFRGHLLQNACRGLGP